MEAKWNHGSGNAVHLELIILIRIHVWHALIENILDTLAAKFSIGGQGRHEFSRAVANGYLIMIAYPDPFSLTERVIICVFVDPS